MSAVAVLETVANWRWRHWRRGLCMFLECAFQLFAAIQFLILLHELAHGMTGVALGGSFPFFHMYPAGGRAIVLFPYGAPEWKHFVMMLAGGAFELLLAVALLPVALNWRRPLTRLRLFGLLLGGAGAADMLLRAGVLAWPGGIPGEAGQALSALLPWGLELVVRTALTSVAIVLVTVFIRALARAAGERSGLCHQQLGTRWRQSGAVVAIILIGQAVVFGYGIRNPRGLFLARRPAEVTVAACNARILIGKCRTRVSFLMRPFVSQHAFLWERIREAEPADWGHYRRFARDNVPRLVSTSNWKLIRAYVDKNVPFYADGDWSKGARVVEADLGPLPAYSEDTTLIVRDFWKQQRIGYLDMVEVEMEDGLLVRDIETAPLRPGSSPELTNTGVRWLNREYNDAFETWRLQIGSTR